MNVVAGKGREIADVMGENECTCVVRGVQETRSNRAKIL